MPESMKRFFRPGGIANLALGAIALVVFLAVGVASIPKLGGSRGGVPEVSVPPNAVNSRPVVVPQAPCCQ